MFLNAPGTELQRQSLPLELSGGSVGDLRGGQLDEDLDTRVLRPERDCLINATGGIGAGLDLDGINSQDRVALPGRRNEGLNLREPFGGDDDGDTEGCAGGKRHCLLDLVQGKDERSDELSGDRVL